MTETQSKRAALEGLKILDFSHVYQGPVGTQILADYGADVIKVERPGVGDWSRSLDHSSKVSPSPSLI